MSGISGILPQLADRDTKERLAGVGRLEQHLQRHGVDDGSIEGSLVDALVALLADNNFKVCQSALGCLELVVQHLDSRFRSHFNLVLGVLVDRLGDNKTVVRQKALDVLQCMVRVLSPGVCLDKIIPLLSHKNGSVLHPLIVLSVLVAGRVREQTLYCLSNTLDEFGPDSMSLPKMLPHLVKRLDDSQKDVRQAAISALEEWYCFVGGPLRNELLRRDIRPAILKMLFERFDEVESGGPVETNVTRVNASESTSLSRVSSQESLPTPTSTRSSGSSTRNSAPVTMDTQPRPTNSTSSTPRSGSPASLSLVHSLRQSMHRSCPIIKKEPNTSREPEE